MKRLLRWSPMLLLLLMLPGCGGNKGAAEQALASADAAYGKISEQAQGLAPDQAQSIEAALVAAHETLAKGDGKAALAATQALESRIRALADELPALQTKLQSDWSALVSAVPGALAAAQKKLEDFGRPPEGMPGVAELDAASKQLAQLRLQWADAQSLAEGGKLAQAAAMGEQVRYDAVRLVTEFRGGS